MHGQVLFNDTLWHNIAYGNPDASKDQVLQAARAAQLEDTIGHLEDGFDTMVGSAASDQIHSVSGCGFR